MPDDVTQVADSSTVPNNDAAAGNVAYPPVMLPASHPGAVGGVGGMAVDDCGPIEVVGWDEDC